MKRKLMCVVRREMKKFSGLFLMAALALGVSACRSQDTADGGGDQACAVCAAGEPCPKCEIVKPIEAAHNKEAYYANDAVKADLDVNFGGNDVLDGTMWFTPDTGKVRMELDNGTTVVWDGQACWVSPDVPDTGPGFRFHVLTWPYFMAAPFKLSDPGTHHELKTGVALSSKTSQNAAKLTFDAGVGDAPDDWYLVFKNPQDDSLAALAYIVTYNKSAEKAEEDPHIIFYTDPVAVDGVVFATKWKFHAWREDVGVTGEPIGDATLSNIAFVTPPKGAFEKPDGAVEATMPQ